MATLLDIPEEIIRYIASSFLIIEDVVHLSMSCKILYHMLPTYSFEYKKIVGPDIDEIEPKDHCESWLGVNEECPSWEPSFYFDTPPFTSYPFIATITAKFKNLGCYYRNIYILLIRREIVTNKPVIIKEVKNRLCFEPPTSGSIICDFHIDDPIMQMTQPGDYWRFMNAVKNVGESGGHEFKITKFRVHTLGIRKRPKITEEIRDSSTLTMNNIESLQAKNEMAAILADIGYSNAKEFTMNRYVVLNAFKKNMFASPFFKS